ncbi:hypothetical protein C8R48DRAFT_91911 [Suillus tomentosus]|nr:hypothetical protein C8R48DRAFT_91911 [Suillus tomentosus]
MIPFSDPLLFKIVHKNLSVLPSPSVSTSYATGTKVKTRSSAKQALTSITSVPVIPSKIQHVESLELQRGTLRGSISSDLVSTSKKAEEKNRLRKRTKKNPHPHSVILLRAQHSRDRTCCKEQNQDAHDRASGRNDG